MFLNVVMSLTIPSVFYDIMPINSYFTRSTVNEICCHYLYISKEITLIDDFYFADAEKIEKTGHEQVILTSFTVFFLLHRWY